MNKTDYMNSLLKLCTEKQANLFARMYPDGPKVTQIGRAIQQIEATLKGLNSQEEEFKRFKADSKAAREKLEGEIKSLILELSAAVQENEELNRIIHRLSNPITIANNKIQERLELLDALEAGGVDNWTFYDESITQYRANL